MWTLQRPDLLWGPPSLTFNGHRRLFLQKYSAWGMKLFIVVRLWLRLRSCSCKCAALHISSRHQHRPAELKDHFRSNRKPQQSALVVQVTLLPAGLKLTGCRVQTTDYRPQATDHRLQTTDHRPQTTDYRPQATNWLPWGSRRVWYGAGGQLAIGRITGLLLVEATDCPTATNGKHQAFWVACKERLHFANAFRVGSNTSSFTMKCCACASIAFLAGIISWFVDSNSVHNMIMPVRIFELHSFL
jgi:CD68 antigen